jgi:hypothetical protein
MGKSFLAVAATLVSLGSLPAAAMPLASMERSNPFIQKIYYYRGGGYHGGYYHRGYGYHPGWHGAYGYHGGYGRWGAWARPGGYWWHPGGAIAAGAAIGFVGAATAAAWAGPAPGPGLCWYYTTPARTQGFWDACQ